MDAFNILENSYIIINRNSKFYKKNFGHTYYLNVNDDETRFIDKMFKNMENPLSAQDKMLNYSVSTIYTATAVLVEFMNRYGIIYSDIQLEEVCKGFSVMEKEEIALTEKSDDDLKEVLLGLLTEGIDLESRKKSGSERTPDEIINYMLDMVGYGGKNVNSKSIVDPACGTGTFVAKMIERFIKGVDKTITTTMMKEKLLSYKLVRAYDMKPSNVYVTKIVVLSVLIRNGFVNNMEDVLDLLKHLPIYCKDFLQVTEKTDFVVGNPPYIRLQNLSNEYREFMKRNYMSATGRFDIYTCFIENADKILNENGKMCFITSNKYLTANYGVGIRKYLSKKGHVRKIVDLFDTKFFGAAVLPAIILCENKDIQNDNVEYVGIKSTSKKAQYHCLNVEKLFEYIEKEMKGNKSIVICGKLERNVLEISKSKVSIPSNGETWNFSSNAENDIKNKMDEKKLCTLEDVFDVCVGIKTTADSVFVKPMTEEFVKKHEFEEIIIYPLIQSFNVNKWSISWGNTSKDRYILYPHKELQGNMVAISLEEVPKARKYLEDCSDVLKRRSYLTESKTREWYECWVPQKLSKFQQIKIVTRDIVNSNSFALDESGMLCQGNTFFLTRKQSVFNIEYSSMTERQYYCFVLGILNSKVLEYYQKMISGCLYSQKYRYTTTNLNRWPIPRIELKDAIKIAEYVDRLLRGEEKESELEREIDKIMYVQFGLDEEEIFKVESFIGVTKEEDF